MKILFNISIITVLLSVIWPCDCAPPPYPEEAYEMADVVFSGEVTNVILDWNNLIKEVSIDVYDVWKGSIGSQIIILTGIDDGICGYNFQVNEEYLIYGNYSGDYIWTNICTRTNLLDYASEDLDYLNQLSICDSGYTEYDGECYYDEDLNFLTLLIYMNEIEFELHYDIGLTIWQNGRINTLLLEGMAIHEIPNNIQNLDSLVHLSFSDNELEYLPDEIGNLPSLKALFLSNNILVEIPETIGNLGNLEFFHMPENQLTELPFSISNLSSLISFNIDNNYFTTFPSSLLELNNLKYVYIANNAINSLPTNINMILSIQILSAYSNNISILPSSVGELSNLYHFDFANNDLTTIPETICNIYDNLTVFDIGLNDICPPYPECLTEEDVGYQDTTNCEPECDLGDVNCDGDLNVLDVVLMVNMILTDEYDEIADVNEDGVLNVLDVVTLVNWVIFGNVCIDYDGNVYETVQIGEQLWMAENLKVTHYQNSDEIPYIYNDPQYGAYINYSNNADNGEVYGRLYNWFAVNDERGLCPYNWHVPSDDEFKSLEMYLGMSESEANGEGLRGTDEGGKLKEEGNEHWNSPNTGATNETDFTALPGGNRRYETYTNQEIFSGLNRYGFFWSSSEVYTVNAWYRVFSFDYSESNRFHLSKTNAFSIRCVED